MITVFFIMFVITAALSVGWASGIHEMKEKHPDYKGEDFLNDKPDKDENLEDLKL